MKKNEYRKKQKSLKINKTNETFSKLLSMTGNSTGKPTEARLLCGGGDWDFITTTGMMCR